MIQGMLWMIAVYGISMSIVHLVHLRVKRKQHNGMIKHIVLVSSPTQLQIEWYIRSLLFIFWCKGKPITLTVIDEGTNDETLNIVYKCSKQCRVDIQVLISVRDQEACQQLLNQEDVTVIDLNRSDDLRMFQPS